VIGPDYFFSLVEIAIANAVVWGAALVPALQVAETGIFSIGIVLLVL
jgi:hypothetical protein